MKKRLFGLVCLLLGVAAGTLAASHWTVNPHAFQYDMTAYVALSVVQQEDYELAAFCNGECRGVGKLLTAEGGTQVFQLRIRSNTPTGDIITFRAYNKQTSEEHLAKEDVTFETQAVVGTPSEPLLLLVDVLLKGDANGDGVVDVADVVAIVNYILNKPGENFNTKAADVNEDGVINVADVVAMVSICKGPLSY